MFQKLKIPCIAIVNSYYDSSDKGTRGPGDKGKMRNF